MQRLTCDELMSVWNVQRAIEKEQRRLVDLRVLASPPVSRLVSSFDDMPHAKIVSAPFEQIAGLIIECQSKINHLSDVLAQQKFNLLTKLQSLNLNELQQRVLSYHYVACLKFKEIARLMKCSYTYVQILHRKGLKALGLSVDELNGIKNSSIFIA